MYSNMLELAISMIFLYLMLSAACSAVQEIIANIFRWRAKTLEKGIAGLLDASFKEELYKTPLISGLCSPNARGRLTKKPSYIPPATFALAVLQVSAANPPTFANSKAATLLASLLRGTNGVDEQKKRLEDWFDGSMDRISGWYKRKANLVLWIISVILCIFVNADSISLANAFWHDPALRAAITTAATEKVKNQSKPAAPNPTTPNNAPSAGTPASTADQAAGSQPATDSDALQGLDQVRKELAKDNIPLGWCWKAAENQKKCFPELTTMETTGAANAADPRMIMASESSDPYAWWFLKLLGIVVTALAISQGAPFWFDLLQKAVNLRLAGDAPDEKQKK